VTVPPLPETRSLRAFSLSATASPVPLAVEFEFEPHLAAAA
jgi:hypothetical protein